jgi:hypothetical protein
LREFFRAKLGGYTETEFSSGELMREREIGLTQSQIKLEVNTQLLSVKSKTDDSVTATNENLVNKNSSSTGSILQLNDAADEFFDVPDEAEYELDEAPWSSADSVTSSVGILFHLSIYHFCFVHWIRSVSVLVCKDLGWQ